MSRVSHLQIRRLLGEERERITDRELFSSRILAAHFEDMAAAQTGRYGVHRRISVHLSWSPGAPMVAFTDHNGIYINTGCELVTSRRTRRERYNIICGIFAHELGHNLFTDSPCSQTYAQQTAAGSWYPEAPRINSTALVDNEKDFWEFIRQNNEHLKAYLTLAQELWNTLEDGFVDDSIVERFPGKLGVCLQYAKDVMFESAPTVTQLIESETDERLYWHTIQQMLIEYARGSEISYGETPLSDEHVQTLYACINSIDDAIISPYTRDRWRAVNRLILENWPRVRAYLEYCEEQSPQSESQNDDGIDALSEMLQSMPGSTQAPKGTLPTMQGGGSGQSAPQRRRMRMDANNASQPQDDGTGPQASDGTEPETNDQAGASEDAGMLPSGTDDAEDAGADDGFSANTLCPTFGGIGRSNSGSVHGEDEWDDAYTGSGALDPGKEIEELLSHMAESRLEQKRTRALNELAQTLSYGNIHGGVKKTIHRIREVDHNMKAEYDSIAPPLLRISRRLQQSIQRQLQDRRRGGKQTGLYMGRKLDVHALPRNDGRVFYKNSLPNETPDLAVGLLLDESGSMCCNERSVYARATAIILYDFCRSLHIPITIYGHSTGSGVDLYSYAEFDDIDRMDKYRLMDITHRDCNRDGAALRYVAERLVPRPEDVKLLILVSDGLPNDGGYGGEAAEEDLRGIKQEYRRKGVHLIAAAIGEDQETIERIYGNSFVNISDLNKLPVLLTQKIKSFIRV